MWESERVSDLGLEGLTSMHESDTPRLYKLGKLLNISEILLLEIKKNEINNRENRYQIFL